jgi:hypothetical protein
MSDSAWYRACSLRVSTATSPVLPPPRMILSSCPRNFPFLLVATVVLVRAPQLWSQGGLTPPGAPVPTMKTLAQIEPRTPIGSAPYTISASGSYYLTSDVTVSSGNAITITAGNVTLDLNGFTISSSSNGLGTGVLINGGIGQIRILNGRISASVSSNGFATGISDQGASTPVLVANVSVSHCSGTAISVAGGENVVESCSVSSAGGQGIVAGVVSRSSVVDALGYGITATIARECAVYNFTNAIGISASVVSDCHAETGGGTAIQGEFVSNCHGYAQAFGTTATGINGFFTINSQGTGSTFGIVGETVINSTGTGTTAINAYIVDGCTAHPQMLGISVTAAGRVSNCVVNLNGFSGTGIWVDPNSPTTVTDCVIGGGAIGISVGTNSTVTGCTVLSNSGNAIVAPDKCYIARNKVSTVGGNAAGIYVSGAGNSIDANEATGYAYGIQVNGTGNLVTANRAHSNATANYNIAAGNIVSAIVAPSTNVAPILGNSGGAPLGPDASANIAY